MSDEAIPINNAYFEANKEHPDGGETFKESFHKKVEEIKERSVEEKKQGYLKYRRNMFWAGIDTQEVFDKKRQEAIADYQSGNFFLERIGRYREVDVPLTLVLLHLRKQWIKEYDVKTAPEFMLLDMALTSYFHFIRINEDINNIMSSIEWSYFALDAPKFETNYYGDRLGSEREDRAVAEKLAYRLQEVLQPVCEQYNRSFIRNLKALRDLRRGNIQLNIGNVGQMNFGDKQINVENNVE